MEQTAVSGPNTGWVFYSFPVSATGPNGPNRTFRWEFRRIDPRGPRFRAIPDHDGRLIRRYPPEKFPAEFQRVRAAFEQVDDELRYHAVEESESPTQGTGYLAKWLAARAPSLA